MRASVRPKRGIPPIAQLVIIKSPIAQLVMSDIIKSEIGYLANADHHHHQWTKCPVARAPGVLSFKDRQIWQKQGLLFLTTCNETEEVID